MGQRPSERSLCSAPISSETSAFISLLHDPLERLAQEVGAILLEQVLTTSSAVILFLSAIVVLGQSDDLGRRVAGTTSAT